MSIPYPSKFFKRTSLHYVFLRNVLLVTIGLGKMSGVFAAEDSIEAFLKGTSVLKNSKKEMFNKRDSSSEGDYQYESISGDKIIKLRKKGKKWQVELSGDILDSYELSGVGDNSSEIDLLSDEKRIQKEYYVQKITSFLVSEDKDIEKRLRSMKTSYTLKLDAEATKKNLEKFFRDLGGDIEEGRLDVCFLGNSENFASPQLFKFPCKFEAGIEPGDRTDSIQVEREGSKLLVRYYKKNKLNSESVLLRSLIEETGFRFPTLLTPINELYNNRLVHMVLSKTLRDSKFLKGEKPHELKFVKREIVKNSDNNVFVARKGKKNYFLCLKVKETWADISQPDNPKFPHAFFYIKTPLKLLDGEAFKNIISDSSSAESDKDSAEFVMKVRLNSYYSYYYYPDSSEKIYDAKFKRKDFKSSRATGWSVELDASEVSGAEGFLPKDLNITLEPNLPNNPFEAYSRVTSHFPEDPKEWSVLNYDYENLSLYPMQLIKKTLEQNSWVKHLIIDTDKKGLDIGLLRKIICGLPSIPENQPDPKSATKNEVLGNKLKDLEEKFKEFNKTEDGSRQAKETEFLNKKEQINWNEEIEKYVKEIALPELSVSIKTAWVPAKSKEWEFSLTKLIFQEFKGFKFYEQEQVSMFNYSAKCVDGKPDAELITALPYWTNSYQLTKDLVTYYQDNEDSQSYTIPLPQFFYRWVALNQYTLHYLKSDPYSQCIRQLEEINALSQFFNGKAVYDIDIDWARSNTFARTFRRGYQTYTYTMHHHYKPSEFEKLRKAFAPAKEAKSDEQSEPIVTI